MPDFDVRPGCATRNAVLVEAEEGGLGGAITVAGAILNVNTPGGEEVFVMFRARRGRVTRGSF